MLKVGITGQSGFVGKHLYNTLGLFPDEFERIDFDKMYFEQEVQMDQFVTQCDIIVHLAGMNRHHDPQVIYDTNIKLTTLLVASLNRCKSKSHVIFSSSTQENRDNLYGKSKQVSREILSAWAAKSEGNFTGLLIPNVYGPFGNPHYNSVIATFCHQLTHNTIPVIENDSEVRLIYVGELVESLLACIRSRKKSDMLSLPHTHLARVSEILSLLKNFQEQYFLSGIVPAFNNLFERNLFNTFRSYIDISSYFPVKYKQHSDPRGTFVEVIRENGGGQSSFSTTLSGITRGNHFHTRKIERFAVIKGEALIQLRQIGTNNTMDFHLSGDEPAYVDMPVWHTHNIKNIGTGDLLTIFWINEFFDPADADTYIEIV